jgi:hypothetical protein
MKYIPMQKVSYALAAIFGIVSLAAVPVSAVSVKAAAATSTNTTSTSASAKASANSQAHLQRIITRGNAEIDRRLATLGTLGTLVSSATKLSSSDATTLRNTVSNDTSSLTSLKTQLDGETTVTAATADAQSIILNYRVYALVDPQVHLVKTADDQQVTEGKLATLSTTLGARITAAQQVGTNVTALQASLSDLNSKVAAAQSISSTIESSVVNLVPSDYNSNHTVLSGDRNQLQTAESDIKAAIADSKNIVAGLPAQT